MGRKLFFSVLGELKQTEVCVFLLNASQMWNYCTDIVCKHDA